MKKKESRYIKHGSYFVKRSEIEFALSYSSDQRLYTVNIFSEHSIRMDEFVDVLETVVLDLRRAQGGVKGKIERTES